MKIFLIIILVFIIFQIISNKEEFQGLGYIQQHEYLQCCQSHGSCSALECQNYLSRNRPPLVLIGYITEKNSTNRYQLFSRKNLNKYHEDYFIKIFNNEDDYIHKKINLRNRYLYDEDEIIFENKSYIVSLYDRNNFYFNQPNNRFYIENPYVGQRLYYGNNNLYNPINWLFKYNNNMYGQYNTHGYIKNLNTNNYNLLFKKYTGRNRWKYFVKKNDILIPLRQYKNKEIYPDDEISFDNTKYKFIELDS